MNNKMFLVEKGTFVVVRNGKKEVSFNSFEEFNKYYPGLDLTGKNYIDYEPDRNIYIDASNTTISAKNAPVPAYESVIDAIDGLIENKNDPFFGIDLVTAKALKKSQIKSEETQTIYEKWPIHKQINAALGVYGETVRLECVNDIKAMQTKITEKENEIDVAQSLEDTKRVRVNR